MEKSSEQGQDWWPVRGESSSFWNGRGHLSELATGLSFPGSLFKDSFCSLSLIRLYA